MTALIAALRKRGWVIHERPAPVVLLLDALRDRYPSVPGAVADFLGRLEVAHNAEENAWFLTPEDFLRTDPDDGFRWNEYEHMALENEASSGGRAAIRAFWDDHLPIMMAVHSDYDYLAVRLAEPNKGAIVHGFAPDWESPSEIASSFDAFLRQFATEAGSNSPEFPYDVFV